MRKLSRSFMSIAIIGLLSCSSYSAEGDSVEDEQRMNSNSTLRSTTISQLSTTIDDSLRGNKIENKSTHSSGWGLIKNLMMGALMLSAPTVVEAQNQGFVGCYWGYTLPTTYQGGNMYSYGTPIIDSNNITINSLTLTNWNSYNKNYPVSFGSKYPSNFSIAIQCDRPSYCKNMNIKSAYLCNKTFDVDYYASMENQDLVVPNPNNGFSYYPFYLSVWDSLSENNTEFDKVFSGYMTTRKC